MLQFPKDISNKSDSFLMIPISYRITLKSHRFYQKINKIPDSVKIILPTPSEGLNLTEGSNWDETEGLISFKEGAKAGFGKKMIESGGTPLKHLIKGEFINDYASLSYNGSNFRTYSFSWDLIPSSEEEATILSKIISKIRKESLPTYTGQLIHYPAMWNLFPVSQNPMGIYIQDCVITNFTVNYTPDGVLRMYKTGHPLSVKMSIDFKELYRASQSDVPS